MKGALLSVPQMGFSREEKSVPSLTSKHSSAGPTNDTLYAHADAPVSHALARNGGRYVLEDRTLLTAAVGSISGSKLMSIKPNIAGTVGTTQGSDRCRFEETVRDPGEMTTTRVMAEEIMDRRSRRGATVAARSAEG